MYQFYLNEELYPVPPSSLKVKIANNNKTISLINGGTANILKLPGLSEISFDLLLPNAPYSFAAYLDGFQPASYFLDKLEALKNSLKPFPFQIIRANSGYNTALVDSKFIVSLESYEILEDANRYGLDMLVSISLKQYREYSTKLLVFKNDGTAAIKEDRDTSTKNQETAYTVKAGDNLWNIAKIHLGDGSRNTEIYELNQAVIEAAAQKYGRASSSKGWWIYPGTVLKLPT